MKRRLSRAAAMILVLIMVLTQFLVVFADSREGSEPTRLVSEDEIRSTIMEGMERGLEQNADDQPGKQAAEKRQVLQSDSDLKDKENQENQEIVPDQLIVKYKSGTSNMEKSALNAKVSAVSSKSFDRLGFSQIKLAKGTDVKGAMDKLKYDPSVEYVEPVYVRKMDVLAVEESSTVVDSVYCKDTSYTKGWQWGLEAIAMEDLWGTVTKEERAQVTIAVVDTGVDVQHSEFAGNIIPGYDFVNSDADADDDNGHGTHVAGIAAAAHDNKGIAGVAGGARIMPVKALDERGQGDTVKLINGILFAVNNGADIINLSLSGYNTSRAEEEVIAYALTKGVTVIASAGNNYAGEVAYPAAYDGVIAVGAVDWDQAAGKYRTAEFSNVGPELDILAPGVDILSSIPIELDNPWNGTLRGLGDVDKDGYSMADGTSMAAPFVSGMAAMLLAEDPRMSCAQVLQQLQDDGIPFEDSYYSSARKINVNVDSYVLNSGYGIKTGIRFPRVILTANTGYEASKELQLCFEDSKSTVAEAVYGTFSLMKREYTYSNGFQWAAAPVKAAEININKGQKSGKAIVDTGELNKKLVFYVEGPEGYMDSNPIFISNDSNNTFSEAKVLPINTEINGALDFGSDEDYFKLIIESDTEGCYIIESTGELDTYGYLYDAGYNLIAEDDEGGTGSNFCIYKDSKHNELYLSTGTYYVKVEGYSRDELGSYGITAKKLDTISGTVSLPPGITLGIHTKMTINIYKRTLVNGKESYQREYARTVTITAGNTAVNYEMRAEKGSDYIVGYSASHHSDVFVGTGYYNPGGTVPLISNATEVSAGAKNVNMTMIGLDDIDDNERNTLETAAPFRLGQMANGTMHYDGDIDLYKLTIDQPGFYAVGAETSSDIRANMYGALYIIDDTDLVLKDRWNYGYYSYWEDGQSQFRCLLYYLESGTYYYAAYGYTSPFNTFAYKIGVKRSSAIEGRIRFAPGSTTSEYVGLEIKAEDTQGNKYVYYYMFEPDYDEDWYTLAVPAADNYILSYWVEDYDGDSWPNANRGYYSTNGTKPDIANATPINATINISDKDLYIIPKGGNSEDDSQAQAKQVSIGAVVRGTVGSTTDVDYYRFTVPQGGGVYAIYTESEEDVSIYLETEGQWLLYNEGYSTVTGDFMEAGVHYLKIRSQGDYCGEYAFTVVGINKPVASNVTIDGVARVSNNLTGRYTYSDKEGKPESGSAYRWLRSDTAGGTYTAIAGATARTYRLTQSDLGKYIKFEVIPKTTIEPKTGDAVLSSPFGPIAAEIVNPGTTPGGGGGGGGGGGSVANNNNTTYEQTGAGTATVRKQADGKTTVEVKVDSSKLNSALTAPGSAPVTIDVNTKASQDKLGVNIPSGVFSQAAAAQKPVVVNSNNADFTFQPGTFDSNSLSGDVKLEVSQLTTDSIPDSMKNKDAANNEVSLVFDFDLSIGGNKVTDFNKPVSITIKIDPSKVADMSKVGVYYYNEKDGIWEYVGGTVNQDGTVTFTVDHFSMYMAMEYKKIFDDIANHWAKADIELLLAKHIARSESEKSFAPNSSITRAAFASMVVKALDIKGVSTDKAFTDIPSNSWYKEDVYKAYAAGVIDGVSSSEFAPGQLITREQMATMLMRAYEYATGKKLDEIVTTANVRFNDESSISSWARRNVVLANATGFVAGNPDGTYNPKGNTTKAQAAVVIKRLMEKLNRL